MAFSPWGRGRLSLFSKDLSVHCLQDAGFPEQGGGLINDLKKKAERTIKNQEPTFQISGELLWKLEELEAKQPLSVH